MGIITPGFWFRPLGAEAVLLSPLGSAYAGLGKLRRKLVAPAKASTPLVVVGNIVAGGAGKTPVVLSLARNLIAQGINVHIIAKGYGGKLKGPLRVNPNTHAASDVGDEPLLLAQVAPTWIASDRGAGWQAAAKAGAQLVISDDGMQNPRLKPDLTLLVVDGVVGLGNQRLIPAGPLREDVTSALKRTSAIIQIGGDAPRILLPKLPPSSPSETSISTLYADYILAGAEWTIGARILPFAGIGRPEKFFAACHTSGAQVVDTIPFPDHHPYSEKEIRAILARADAHNAVPVTTAKDHIRIPLGYREHIRMLDGNLVWRDPAAIAGLTASILECINKVDSQRNKTENE